jgi:hypothetical protein
MRDAFNQLVARTRAAVRRSNTGDNDQVPGPVNFLMNPSMPAAVFASYLLDENAERLINAGVETAVR